MLTKSRLSDSVSLLSVQINKRSQNSKERLLPTIVKPQLGVLRYCLFSLILFSPAQCLNIHNNKNVKRVVFTQHESVSSRLGQYEPTQQFLTARPKIDAKTQDRLCFMSIKLPLASPPLPTATGSVSSLFEKDRSKSRAATVKKISRSISDKPLPSVPVIKDSEVSFKRTMSQTEMAAMSAAGGVLAVSILYVLASSGEVGSVAEVARLETLEVTSYNLLNAAVPMSVSDVLAVSIGEAIAGVIGALASFGFSNIVKRRMNKRTMPTTQKFSDAVADGDFLLTQAAAFPLLQGVGLTPFLATTASVLVAMLPYSLIKVGQRRREQLIEEDRLLQEYLNNQLEKEEQFRQQNGKWPFPLSFAGSSGMERPIIVPLAAVDPKRLQPIIDTPSRFDFVELFSDVTKWLQFKILASEFGGELQFAKDEVLFSGEESAIFGAIATLSSQLYSDMLYGYFGFGGKEKRELILSRTFPEWSEIYFQKLIYAVALFGVYETVQIPAKFLVNAFLSGGVDNCVGSDDVKACIETYILLNPPGASPEAQLRSMITAAYSLWNKSIFSDLISIPF